MLTDRHARTPAGLAAASFRDTVHLHRGYRLKRFALSRGWITLRMQLLLLLGVLVLPLAALLTWEVVRDFRDVHRLADQRLATVAREAAEHLTARLRESERMLGRLAQRPMIKTMQSAPCDPIFYDLAQLHPEYLAMALRTVDAKALCVQQQARSQPQTTAMPRFAEVLLHGGFTASDIFSGQDGRWGSALTQVVRNGTGATVGVLTTVLDVTAIGQGLIAKLSPDVPLVVTDSNHRILLSTTEPSHWVGKPVPATLLDKARDLRNGYVTAKGVDSVSRRHAVVTVEGTGWRVYASTPQTEIAANVNALARDVLAVGCGVLALTVLLAWLVARGILKPLQALFDMASRVAEGDLTAYVAPAGPREIKLVARQVNQAVQLQAARNEARALHKTALMLMASSTPIEDILLHVARSVPAEHAMLACSIHRLDHQGALLRMAAAHGLTPAHEAGLRDIAVGPDAGPFGAVIEAGACVALEDRPSAPAELQWRERVLQDGFVAGWLEPLKDSAGKTIGIFTVYSRDTRKLNTGERESVAEAIQVAGLAIERQGLGEALRLTSERLALAHLGANEGLWDWDLVENKVYYSPRFRELLGYTSPVAFRRVFRIADAMHPADWIRVKAVSDCHLYQGGAKVDEDYRLRCADGCYRWFHGRGGVSRDAAGRPLRFCGTLISISARKQAEESLYQSEERFRALTALSTDWYWEQDENFRYTKISGNQAVYSEMSNAAYLGKTHWELPSWSVYDPDCVRHAEQVERHEPFHDYLVWRTSGDGSVRITSMSGEPVYDEAGQFKGYHGVGHDVTELKVAEQEVKSARHRLEEVIQAAGVIVWEADPQTYALTFVSAHAAQLLGYPIAQWLEEPGFWRDHLHPDDREKALVQWLNAVDGEGVTELEYRMIGRDGRKVWLRDFISVSKMLGEPKRLRGMMTDISLQRNSDAVRHELEAQLRESQKMEAIGTLAGGIAHDFNNILGAILGNVALAKKDVEAAHRAHISLDEIARAGNRAKLLVQQILSFSRRQPQEMLEQHLHPLVVDVLSMLRATLSAGTSLTHEVCESALCIRGDATQIAQVLMNLCTNAHHALGPHGTGTIVVALAEAWLDVAQAHMLALAPGRYARLSVRDNGGGMDSATQARIFEPFFTTKARGEGTGLGLSVVHGIVKSHGGAIDMLSAPGHGTTVTVYLPVLDQPSLLSPSLIADTVTLRGAHRRGRAAARDLHR